MALIKNGLYIHFVKTGSCNQKPKSQKRTYLIHFGSGHFLLHLNRLIICKMLDDL